MILEIFLAGCIVGFSLLLFATSLASYLRLRHARFAYISIAFLLFLAMGALALFEQLSGGAGVSVEVLGLDLLILLFMYLAVAKR